MPHIRIGSVPTASNSYLAHKYRKNIHSTVSGAFYPAWNKAGWHASSHALTSCWFQFNHCDGDFITYDIGLFSILCTPFIFSSHCPVKLFFSVWQWASVASLRSIHGSSSFSALFTNFINTLAWWAHQDGFTAFLPGRLSFQSFLYARFVRCEIR